MLLILMGGLNTSRDAGIIAAAGILTPPCAESETFCLPSGSNFRSRRRTLEPADLGAPEFMAEFIQKSVIAALFGLALSACTTGPITPETAAGINAYSTDRPSFVRIPERAECVSYARQVSGIQIYGDAHTWWDQAAGRYSREPLPRYGSVMVLYGYAGPKRGHLATVTRVVSNREIRVDHANWLNDGNLYLNSPVIDVSPQNDWSLVRVYNNRDGHMGANNYKVRGFIGSARVASAH